MRREAIARVIAAYDDPIIRAYSWGRFLILPQRFLDEIGQYLPAEGPILDIGCGFGLFSLYYAQLIPAASFRGLDLNPRRLAQATEAARRLGPAHTAPAPPAPPEGVEPPLSELHKAIRPGGCLLVKDVDTQPAYKRWFTHALDLLMSPGGVIHYWPAGELAALLQRIGFPVLFPPVGAGPPSPP